MNRAYKHWQAGYKETSENSSEHYARFYPIVINDKYIIVQNQ